MKWYEIDVSDALHPRDGEGRARLERRRASREDRQAAKLAGATPPKPPAAGEAEQEKEKEPVAA